MAGKAGIPADAVGVVLNVTGVRYPTAGWLTVYPNGQAAPASSDLNIDPRPFVDPFLNPGTAYDMTANSVIARVGSGGQVCVRVGTIGALPGSSHVILDVPAI